MEITSRNVNNCACIVDKQPDKGTKFGAFSAIFGQLSERMTNLEFNKNEDQYRQLMDQLRNKLSKISEGGGKKNADKQREQGKLLARERIQYLIDKGSHFIEIGARQPMACTKNMAAVLQLAW